MTNIKKMIFMFGLLFLSACGTMPQENYNYIHQVPADQILESEFQLLEKRPPRMTLQEGQVDFSFSKNSPLLKTEQGPAPAATVRFVNENSGKFLVVWSWLHKASFAKVGVVFPKLSVYDSTKSLRKIKIVQEGEEDSCGIFRCRKMAYDISELEKGTYQLVLVATVADPEKSLMLSEINTGTLYPLQVPVYADYFGDLRISLQSVLPFP